MNLIFFHCLTSAILAWDASPSTDVTGYRIHQGYATNSYQFHYDAGNVLTFKIPTAALGVKYFYAATAYNALGGESVYSNEISYTDPVPPMSLEMAGSGTLIAHVFPGDFILEGSTDLITWTALQPFTTTQDRQKLSMVSSLPAYFFRLKYVPQIPTLPSTASPLIAADSLPPLPPDNVKPKRSELAILLRYKKGQHPDTRKAAERMR